MDTLRKIIAILLTALLPLCVNAQEELEVQHGDCLPTGLPQQSYADGSRLSAPHRLPAINTEWDATKTYKQLVVLVEFSDLSFFEPHDKDFYEKVFNVFDESAYEGKTRYGLGSVADYYRIQSGGMLNLSFDIVGPYKVQKEAKTNDSHKETELREAAEMMVADQQERDFSQYDWNNDGYIEQVIFVVAGPSGNVNNQKGYLHPNTSFFSAVTTHDGIKISNFNASAEVWTLGQNVNCGIGTICHEYSHSLGLPDIYPTNGWVYSICDEWDLMDGGNFTNYGWLPPNYTPLEKMLLGWLTPTELTEATSITNLPSVADNGTIFQIRHSDTEYLLIENRQQKSWDAGLPGAGLMVWYVNYDEAVWKSNEPNDTENEPRFHPIYADGLDYAAWAAKVSEEGLAKYQHTDQMNSHYLSTAPYPYISEEKVVDAIVEEYLTNIRISENGLASFDFMGGASGIQSLTTCLASSAAQYFDLQGRRVETPVRGQLYVVRKVDGSRYKTIY